jgi:hypothetical protein
MDVQMEVGEKRKLLYHYITLLIVDYIIKSRSGQLGEAQKDSE